MRHAVFAPRHTDGVAETVVYPTSRIRRIKPAGSRPRPSKNTGTGFRPGQRSGVRRCPVSWEANKPEPVVPVAVVGLVGVAVRGAAVPGVVVPAAAAQHPVVALGSIPKSIHDIFSEAPALGLCDNRE